MWLSGPACCIHLRPAHGGGRRGSGGVPSPRQSSGSLLQCTETPPTPPTLQDSPSPPAEEHRASEGRRRQQATFPYDNLEKVRRQARQYVCWASWRSVHPQFLLSGRILGTGSRRLVVQGGDCRLQMGVDRDEILARQGASSDACCFLKLSG